MPTATPCPCLNCGTEITDPNFRVVLFNEDYPDIEIGPYCERCYSLLKVCSGCQKAVLASETTHTGNGEHYCRECMASFATCECCGQQKPEAALRDINGEMICTSCISTKYKMCGCCNTYKRKDTIVLNTSLEGMRRAGIFRKYGNQVCSECFEEKKRHFKLYEIEECVHCGKKYSCTEGQEHPKKYCEKCWNGFKMCGVCHKKEPNIKSVVFMDENGDNHSEYMCQSCKNKNVMECDACGNNYKSSMKTFVKGASKVHCVCPSCADKKECANCSSLFAGSGEYCQTCKRVYINNKCSCGMIRDHESHCRVCNSMGIYSYSHKPKIFYNYIKDKEIKRGNVFFGFENECTFGRDDGNRNNGLKNLYKSYDPTVLVAKSDGSIDGYGYEVVSQPMSLLYFHQLDLGPLLPGKLKKDSSCGLHIHVGRDGFQSEVHLYKVINFLHSCPSFTTYVAGRSFNGYCAGLKTKPSRHLKDSKSGNTERRAMVNLTNKATVEFRLFAGCVTDFELRSKVEFLHALISFEREAPISHSKDLDKFREFMAHNSKTYPNGSVLVAKFVE